MEAHKEGRPYEDTRRKQHLEGRERPLTSQPHEHLDPGLLASRMEKNLFLLFQPPSLRHFAMAALADEYHCYCC